MQLVVLEDSRPVALGPLEQRHPARERHRGAHRHSGEIHAVNLAGSRKLLDTGEVIGPGGYVYEPPGNEDSWMAVGAIPLIVFVIARGAIESLDDHGRVIARSTTRSVTESYRRFVAAHQEAAHADVRSARG